MLFLIMDSNARIQVWHNCDVFYLLMVLLFTMTMQVSSKSAAIGIVIESSAWPDDLQDIFENGPLMLYNDTENSTEIGIESRITVINTTSVIMASNAMCSLMSEGITGIISLVTCRTAAFLASQARTFHVPHVSMIKDSCDVTESDVFTTMLTPHYAIQNQAAADIAIREQWTEVVIVLDQTLDLLKHNDLLLKLSSSYIKSISIRIPSNASKVILTQLKAVEAARVRQIFVFCQPDIAQILFNHAYGLNMLTLHYQWVVVTEEVLPSFIAYVASMNTSNVVILRKALPSLRSASNMCRHFPYANMTLSEMYASDAMTLLADAIRKTFGKELPKGYNASLSCYQSPQSVLDFGREIAMEIGQALFNGMTGDIQIKSDGFRQTTSYEICSTMYGSTKSMYRVGEWSESSRLNLYDDQLYKNNFKDFAHKTLLIASREAIPFTIKHVINNKTVFTGFCIDILNELGERLKFNYTIIEPPDAKWGAPNDDGTWNGMVGMVYRGEIRFAVGPFTITSIRESVTDFTKPYMEDGIGILTRKSTGESQKMFKMFKPFHESVWGFIVASVVIVGILLFVVNYFSPFTAYNMKVPGSSPDEVSLMESIWLIFGSYVEQGGEPYPSAISGRCIVGCWWVFTILMTSTYTANLAAFLTVAINEKPVNSLVELAAQDTFKPLVKDGTNLWSLFKNADSGIYGDIRKKMANGPVVTENSIAYDMVRNGGVAFMTDKTQLEYKILSDCQAYSLADEIFNTAGYGFVLPEDAPFMEAFNYNIIKMQEAGLIDKWRRKWWPSSDKCSGSGRTSAATVLGLDSLGGPFMIYAIVLGVAVLCLIFENMVDSRKLQALKRKLQHTNSAVFRDGKPK